jgi:FkbM family methyltransferase
MYLPEDDTGFSQVLEMGEIFEPEVVKCFREVIRPGMVVVDIGANMGYYTLLASRLVGAQGKVVAIEPELNNLHYLAKNITENSCDNVFVVPYAAGDASKPTILYLSHPSRSGHSIIKPDTTASTTRNQKAVMIALDSFLPKEFYPQVIKMDIEGAELLAIDGMEQILKNNPLEAIIVECPENGASMQGSSQHALLSRLRGFGFQCRHLDAHNVLGVRSSHA